MTREIGSVTTVGTLRTISNEDRRHLRQQVGGKVPEPGSTDVLRGQIMTEDLPFAEDLPYWKTGKSSFDSWLEKAERFIAESGGEVVRQATGRERGVEGMMMEFELDGDTFRVVWPVLPTRREDRAASRRQAATMLYHDVKSRGVRFQIFGARVAFFEFLVLPSGATAQEVGAERLVEALPKLLGVGR